MTHTERAARGALSLTQPQGGSDVAAIRTSARRSGSGYRLTGSKAATNSSVADFILVAARLLDEHGQRRGMAVFVNAGPAAWRRDPPEDKMGGRGVPSCPRPRRRRTAGRWAPGQRDADGFRLAMETLMRRRVAARGVGLAQGAIDHAIGAYIVDRMAFGRPVAEFQGLRWMRRPTWR